MLYTCLRWSASTRAHVHTPLPYLANGWADCVQTWCVANVPLDERLTQVRCGVHLHVRTCTPPSNDDPSSPARPSPIKASYWFSCYYHTHLKTVVRLVFAPQTTHFNHGILKNNRTKEEIEIIFTQDTSDTQRAQFKSRIGEN